MNKLHDIKWQQRWLQKAHEIAAWSKDTVKVGAMVVDDNNNIRGFGYNGIPRNLDDQDALRNIKPLKAWWWEHAERNVIYSAARTGISIENCTMFVTHWPCCDCSRGIIQSGIKCVVVDEACLDPQGVFWPRWQPQIETSQVMFAEAGIRCLALQLPPISA